MSHKNTLTKLFDLYIAAHAGSTFVLDEALIGFAERLDPHARKDFTTLLDAIGGAIQGKEGSRFTIVSVLLLAAYKAQLDKHALIESTECMQDFLQMFSNLIDCVIPPSHPRHPHSRKDVS